MTVLKDTMLVWQKRRKAVVRYVTAVKHWKDKTWVLGFIREGDRRGRHRGLTAPGLPPTREGGGGVLGLEKGTNCGHNASELWLSRASAKNERGKKRGGGVQSI